MIRSYVCRQCRTRIIQHVKPQRNLQWQPRATFTSFRNGKFVSEKQDAASKDEHAQHEAGIKVESGDHVEDEAHRPPTIRRSYVGGGERLQPRRSRYAQYVPETSSDTPPEVDSLPEEDYQYRGTRRLQIESYQETPFEHEHEALPSQSPASSDITIPYGFEIHTHLSANDVEKAWAQFEEAYPSRDSPTTELILQTNLGYDRKIPVLDRLLQAIVVQYSQTLSAPVSPTAMLHKFELLGIQAPDAYAKSIRILTYSLLQSVAAEDAKVEPLLAELLSVWRLFLQINGQVELPVEELDTTWQSIPEYENLIRLTLDRSASRDFNRRLHNFHPRFEPHPSLSFSAISVFLLLSAHSAYAASFSDSLRTQSAPFVRLVRELLPVAAVEPILTYTQNSSYYQQLPEDFQKEWMGQFLAAPSAASAMLIFYKDNPEAGPLANVDVPTYKINLYLARINRILLDDKQLPRLKRLLDECFQDYAAAGQVALPPAIYNRFMTSFTALQSLDEAVKLWNHMVANGLKPDNRTWNAVMYGCVLAKDYEGFNGMWIRLLRSGLVPDTLSWTTRITGLITFKKIDEAFAALEEMGRTWYAFENGVAGTKKSSSKAKSKATPQGINPHTKPSIEIIDGALSAIGSLSQKVRGLRFEKRVELVNRLLRWAGNFSIKPRARTYNNLIKIYMDGGDLTAVLKLLRQMEGENLEADSATFTMLIKASLDNERFSGLSQAEQAERVIGILTEVTAGGVRLNAHAYHNVINQLLKKYGNISATHAVIDFMTARKVTPGALIYTSLFTHYFQQDPPDIEGADSLWEHIMQTPSRATDNFMFDRVVAGYAACGETGKMMAILTRMATYGKVPGWAALTKVIRALVAAGEWDRARALVKQTSWDKGIVGSNDQRRTFIFMAKKLGLMGDEHEGVKVLMEGGRMVREPVNVGSAVETRSAEESMDSWREEGEVSGQEGGNRLGSKTATTET